MVDAIFTKTAKGLAEISAKSGGITPRMRWVLMLVDGKRPVSELRELRPTDDIRSTLGMLEEDGYVVLVDAPPQVTAPPAVTATVATATATTATANTTTTVTNSSIFTPLPHPVDPTRLLHSRNFMANTLKTFIGMVGISSLLDRIENAKNHADLRALFDEWHHTLANSRDGRRELDTLRAKLLQII